MLTKLVSAVGLAGALFVSSAAFAAEADSRGPLRVAQNPSAGENQMGVNNPLPRGDISDLPLRIMNYSREPFRYQISRTSGKTWTEYYSLPSGMVHQFDADPRGGASIIRTMNGSASPGYLFIRFPVPGGFESFKLLGGNGYGYVINSNGYGEIVEPNLTGQPVPRVPHGAQELQLFQLYANHCYFDKAPGEKTPAPGPIMPREPRLPRGQ